MQTVLERIAFERRSAAGACPCIGHALPRRRTGGGSFVGAGRGWQGALLCRATGFVSFCSAGGCAAKIAAVWRSGFNERVLAYRREKGLSPLPRLPAVLVQRMVAADTAGVAFSADPVSGQARRRRGQRCLRPGHIPGFRESAMPIPGGWTVAEPSIDEQIADKRTAHRADPGSHEGVRGVAVMPELANRPCLSLEQVLAVAELGPPGRTVISAGRRTSSGPSRTARCTCCSPVRSPPWRRCPIRTVALTSGTTATSPKATAA